MNPLLYEAKNAANHYEREDLLDLISRMAKELEVSIAIYTVPTREEALRRIDTLLRDGYQFSVIQIEGGHYQLSFPERTAKKDENSPTAA